jgi:hypothetical protein
MDDQQLANHLKLAEIMTGRGDPMRFTFTEQRAEPSVRPQLDELLAIRTRDGNGRVRIIGTHRCLGCNRAFDGPDSRNCVGWQILFDPELHELPHPVPGPSFSNFGTIPAGTL